MNFHRAYNLLGVVFCGTIAAIVGFQLLHSIYSHLRSNSWRPTKATVISIENRPKSAELRYTYDVDGDEFTGNTFAFLSEGSIPDKFLINDRYRVGNQIEVYVNPSDSYQSVVELRSLRFTYLWAHLLIVGFSGIVAVTYWLKSQQPANKSHNRSGGWARN